MLDFNEFCNESNNDKKAMAKDVLDLISSSWFEEFYEGDFSSYIEGDEGALSKEDIVGMISSHL